MSLGRRLSAALEHERLTDIGTSDSGFPIPATRPTTRAVVAFYGDLGSGKTTMIKGVARGLGVVEVVKSPSFVIATEYQGKGSRGQGFEGSRARTLEPGNPRTLSVYHIDLYRIAKADELEGVGFEEYLERDGVCLIEWAERAEALLPERTIHVRLEFAGRGRKIEITGLDRIPGQAAE